MKPVIIKQEDYQAFSEDVVEDLLKKEFGDMVEKISGTGAGKVGDFRVGKKTIEVKGLWSDESGKDNDEFDFVSSGFTVSDKEWDIIKNDSENFQLWVVYRLNQSHKDVKGWPIKYAILSGTELKKCKPTFRRVGLPIPKEFWRKSIQDEVPEELLNKHKPRNNS